MPDSQHPEDSESGCATISTMPCGAERLAAAWRQGTRLEPNVADLTKTYGRLVYLHPGADDSTAHLVNSTRRVAFVADGHSWAGPNFGLSAREILLRNGVQAAWIEEQAC